MTPLDCIEASRRWREAHHDDDPVLWQQHLPHGPHPWLPWFQIAAIYGAMLALAACIIHWGT